MGSMDSQCPFSEKEEMGNGEEGGRMRKTEEGGEEGVECEQ